MNMPKNKYESNIPRWIPVVGSLFGGATLLFLMLLIIMTVYGNEIPKNSRFLVVAVLALGAALSSSFLGGSAAAKGHLPIPWAKEKPITFSVAGGIATFIIIMLIG